MLNTLTLWCMQGMLACGACRACWLVVHAGHAVLYTLTLWCMQGMLADALQPGDESAKRFMNRLFSTLGWTLTEFSVTGTFRCTEG